MKNELTFAQLSDPHLSSLEDVHWRDLASKRLLGYLSWRKRRRAEHRGVVSFTDALAHGFSAGPHWLGCLRGAGLLALDLLPVARHVLARHAMGLAGPQSRLVRGLNP